MRALVGITLFASILLLGTSGIVQQSYAGGTSPVPPPWDRNDDCAVTHQFTTFGTPGGATDPGLQIFGGACSAGSINTDPALNDAFCEITPASATDVDSQIVLGSACHIHVPNFDDPFDTKKLRINVFWTGGLEPTITNVKPAPGATSNDCIFEQKVVIDPASPGLFYEDWRCHPNPDNERIWLALDTGTLLNAVIVDSISFGTVGGTFEGVNTTLLLVSGAQMNAAWMIPVIVSGIGFAIVIARKF